MYNEIENRYGNIECFILVSDKEVTDEKDTFDIPLYVNEAILMEIKKEDREAVHRKIYGKKSDFMLKIMEEGAFVYVFGIDSVIRKTYDWLDKNYVELGIQRYSMLQNERERTIRLFRTNEFNSELVSSIQ